MTIPTMQECVDAAVAAIEAELGQTVPTYDKSFLRALSVVLGMNNAELFRFGQSRAKAVLALTARGDDLDRLGAEYGIVRKVAVKTVLIAQITEMLYISDVNIYRSDALLCEANGLYYFPTQDYTFLLGTAGNEVNVRAEFAGGASNVEGVNLKWSSTPSGLILDYLAVTDTYTVGSDEETDDELRLRILTEIQTVGGGSNAADYRTWGERTPNVKRVDPYTGQEPWTPTQDAPGERTVYVEATESYDPDGLADTTLLDLTRQYIEYDPDTGERQVCLGSTTDTLDVLSITRVTAYFEVNDLSVESSRLMDCSDDITTALDELARSMRPFIQGLDSEAFRNDTLSASLAARTVQRIVASYGGSCGTVYASTISGDWFGTPEPMNPGERYSASVAINVA